MKEIGTKCKVSIIIATYRRDKTLREAIASVMQQKSTAKIEVIVVDDNAELEWNNRVQEIVKAFSKYGKEIQLIVNKKNLGSANSRNRGIEAASGEYVSFLDDDDVYLENKVERQLTHMIRNNADFSITDLALYSENEVLIEKRNRYYIKSYDKDSLLRYHFMFHMTGTDTLMFKKQYLAKIGGFPPIDSGDEFYLMKNAIEAGGKLTYLDVCDIKAYVHAGDGGLSSGEIKIAGENQLYLFKKQYFSRFDKKTQRYISVRHYVVIAFAELRMRRIFFAVQHATHAFVVSPIAFLKILFNVIKK